MTDSVQAIVIVGAGHAGGRAALRLRAEGYGGSITLIGDERWPPYERPPISKTLLAGSAEPESLFLLSHEKLKEKNIEFLAETSAVSIDRNAKTVALSGGRALSYDCLILATGARARPLVIPGSDDPRVFYLRTIDDGLRLRRRIRSNARIVLIGGGFIGLEVAATAVQAGCSVIVLEAANRLLGRVVPPVVSDFFVGLHRQHHVDLHCGVTVQEIQRRETDLTVVTEDGREFVADTVVVGVGSIPNVELARSAGLAVDNGILTDEFCRTSDPAIFAVGDATRHFSPFCSGHVRLETWHNAQNQAAAAAKVILSGAEPYNEVVQFWTDQYDVNFQSTGSFGPTNDVVVRSTADPHKCTFVYLDGETVVGGACVNNLRDMKALKRLVSDRATVDPDRLSNPEVPLLEARAAETARDQ